MKKPSMAKRIFFGVLLMSVFLAMGVSGEEDCQNAVDPLNSVEKDLAAREKIIGRQHELIVADYERLKNVMAERDVAEELLAAAKK